MAQDFIKYRCVRVELDQLKFIEKHGFWHQFFDMPDLS